MKETENVSDGTGTPGEMTGERKSVFVEEAAVRLGVSRRTVYYRIRDGKLRTVRTPGGSQRVLVESIEALRRAEGAEQ